MDSSSYNRTIEQIHQWSKLTKEDLNKIVDEILDEMNQCRQFVQQFVESMENLLIREEDKLSRTTNHKEIDQIEQRIEQIIDEVQLVQSLAFQINFDSFKFVPQIEIRSKFTSIYRFLLSTSDGEMLKKKVSSKFRFLSSDSECLMIIDVSTFDEFIENFRFYFDSICQQKEFRLLIPEEFLVILSEKSNERAREYQKEFQLNILKYFLNPCPNSNEHILLISGENSTLLRNCIEKIFRQISNETIRFDRQFYFPIEKENFSTSQSDYGGFYRVRTIEDETDDDLEFDNDDWWDGPTISDKNLQSIERTLPVDNHQAGVIIGINASRIDRIKKVTGASVYINADAKDGKRTLFVRGNSQSVNCAFRCIEKLLEKHRNGQLTSKPRRVPNRKNEK